MSAKKERPRAQKSVQQPSEQLFTRRRLLWTAVVLAACIALSVVAVVMNANGLQPDLGTQIGGASAQ